MIKTIAGTPTLQWSAQSKCTPFAKEAAKHYMDNYPEYDDLIPSVAGLAVALSVCRDTIYHWANNDDEFKALHAQLMARQEKALLAGGLAKHFATPITELLLGKHGYSKRTDHTSSDGSMTPAAPTIITRRVVSADKG